MRSGFSAATRTFSISDDAYVDFYRTWGFAHFKCVFSAQEVEELRARCFDVKNQVGAATGDLLTYPAFRNVMLDERVLGVARRLLGTNPVYFGESSFAVNHKRDRILHSDARNDRRDPTVSSYPLLRFGIYLQDHARHSDGLKVRPGSHRRVLWNRYNVARLFGVGPGDRLSPRAFVPTRFYNVPTVGGDLVVWNLRTQHCGHAVRLRRLPNLALSPRIENWVPEFAQEQLSRARCAVFMTFGAPSPELDAYVKHRLHAQKQFWAACSFDTPENREACRSVGVTLRTDALTEKGTHTASA